MSRLNRFQEDGFVACHGFLSAEEIVDVNANVNRLITDIVPGMPREHVFFEDKSDASTLKQLQKLFEYDDDFARLIFDSPFQRLAEELLQESVRGVNLQYFNKPPRIGQPTPPHQDGYYFMLDPPHAVTMWLALEDVDEENGCVRYVRGSHRHGLRSHSPTTTLGFSQGLTDFGTDDDLQNEIAQPAAAGDLLVHHALTIHRADGNVSTRTRRALGLIYYGASAVESADKTTRQAEVEQRMRDRGQI